MKCSGSANRWSSPSGASPSRSWSQWTSSAESFIGSMKGTMEIVGDIVAPIDVEVGGGCRVIFCSWTLTAGYGRSWASSSGCRERHCRRIRNAESEGNLRVSVISIWELAMLEKRGRVALPMNVRTWVEQALNKPGIAVAPLTPEIMIESVHLPGELHRRPGGSNVSCDSPRFGCDAADQRRPGCFNIPVNATSERSRLSWRPSRPITGLFRDRPGRHRRASRYKTNGHRSA